MRWFGAAVLALTVTVCANASGAEMIEAKFDFILLPTALATQAMFQGKDAKALRDQALQLAKTEKGAKHDHMIVTGASGFRAAGKGMANIEAEMTAAEDQLQIDQVFMISIGAQEIVTSFASRPGHCVLAGVMADLARPDSHSLLVFTRTEMAGKQP